MTEKELEDLCKPEKGHTGSAPWVYWPVELYSHGKYIREYGFFPSFLPLGIYGDHSSGIQGTDIPAKHELETKALFYATFSKRKAACYTEMTGKRSFVMISPAVYYRRKYGINQHPDARGTVAFAAHSTPNIDVLTDFEQYIQSLKALPLQYQPVTICLHMHDINKGLHKLFLNHGFEVVTAGNTSDYRFVERFYEILRRHSYSTSNLIGSYAALSIEMGIPFFSYGTLVEYENLKDSNLPIGKIGAHDGYPHYQDLYEAQLFESFNGIIEPSVKQGVEEKLGVYDSASRFRVSMILWVSFFHLCFCSPFFLNQLKLVSARIWRKIQKLR